MSQLSILVLCGGQSTEHEISLLSVKNVIEKLDPDKYHVHIAKISQDGHWHYYLSPAAYFSHQSVGIMSMVPGQKNPFTILHESIHIDCVFPVLHGTLGEDGTIQGLLEILNIPYVGADTLGSSIGMDKDVLKRLLNEANLPVVDRCVVKKSEKNNISYVDITHQLGKSLFIKPNSLGSAVGIRKAVDQDSFYEALDYAFTFDNVVLIEKAIEGREVECSVLGNDFPIVSKPGEIIKHSEFYSYDAKYIDGAAATIKTPADLSEKLITEIQSLALKAYKTLRCTGMARVDFFITLDEKVIINEINTIPGFTNISMYPKNWEVSGLRYAELLDRLIELGIERFESKKRLLREYNEEKSERKKKLMHASLLCRKESMDINVEFDGI